MFKIDPSRLAHLDQIRGRELGAVGKLTDKHNDLIRQRTSIRARLAQLESNAKFSHDPDYAPHIAEAKAALAKVESEMISTAAASEAARQRSTAAGQVHRDCERFVESKGRTA